MKDHSKWKRHGKIGACEKHHSTVKLMAEAGATLEAIGKAVGTTKTRVRAYLTRAGICRPNWRNRPSGSHAMSRQTAGALNPAWRGGRTVDKMGYVLVWMPSHPEANQKGQVREHRLIMAKILGRPLLRREVVHHKNKNKQDNRPENLVLYASNGEHLADELRGQCPNWSEEGQRRLVEICRENAKKPRTLTPEGRERIRESSRQMQARRRATSR